MDYTKDAVLIEDLIRSHEDVLLGNHSHGRIEDMVDTASSVNYSENGEYDSDWNDTLDYVPFSMRPETYIVPILFAIIFVIGVLGNGTLIAIFIKHRTMRNVPNMYIVSLAVGDLFVILFCVPFTSTVYTVESWPYGQFVCKFSEFIKDLSIGVSVFTLTALSADRYFAIVDPMRKLHGRRATRITCITIAGIWILSIVMALPSALFSYVRTIDQDPSWIYYVCYPFPPELGDKYPQVMVMVHFLVYYAVPLGFIGTFYIIMARHLVLSTRNMPGEAQGQAKQIQARKKVAKMILSFVVIFALCFAPTHLFLLWFYFNPESQNHFNDFWNMCRITGFCLSFFNSCINPITLYCVSGTFRKQFNEHLFCCICDAEGRSRSNRRRAGFGCGCVSLSSAGPGGHLFGGGDYRYRNGQNGNAGRGLHRGSTTTNSNTMKRKSTWDTQSTMSHPMYNLAVTNTITANGGQNGDTVPISTDALLKHSSANATNLNCTFPLTHHPYQKDYLNRINALEKGEPPPPPPLYKSADLECSASFRRSKGIIQGRCQSHNNQILESQPDIPKEEYTVTSFINLPIADGTTPTDDDDDQNEESFGGVKLDVLVSDRRTQNNKYD